LGIQIKNISCDKQTFFWKKMIDVKLAGFFEADTNRQTSQKTGWFGVNLLVEIQPENQPDL